jgi:hypothetical protein
MSYESHRGSRGTVPLILNVGTRWGWVVKATSQPLYPRGTTPVPIVQDTEWAPGSFRVGIENRNYPLPLGVRGQISQTYTTVKL